MSNKTAEQYRIEILTAFMQGGSFSHNLVSLALQQMESVHGKEESMKVYAELQAMGY